MMRGNRVLWGICLLVVLGIGLFATLGVMAVEDHSEAPPGSEEVIEHRSAHSKKFRNADGSTTLRVAARPIHYRDNLGRWQDIDVNPISAAWGELDPNGEPLAFKVEKNSLKTFFPKRSKGWVTLKHGDWRLGFRLVTKFDNRQFKKERDGAIRVNDLLEHCDVKYKVGKGALKEDIILKRPTATKVFEYQIRLKNLSVTKTEDGGLVFFDNTGETVLFMPQMVMYDANNIVSKDIAVDLTRDGDIYRLRVTPDGTWLSQPERKYPVVVDPTFKFTGDAKYNKGEDYYIKLYIPNLLTENQSWSETLDNGNQTILLNSISDVVKKNYMIKTYYKVQIGDYDQDGGSLPQGPPEKPPTFIVYKNSGPTKLVERIFDQKIDKEPVINEGTFDIAVNEYALVELFTGHYVSWGYDWGADTYFEITYYFDITPPAANRPIVTNVGNGTDFGDTVYTNVQPVTFKWSAEDKGTSKALPSGASFTYGPAGVKQYQVNNGTSSFQDWTTSSESSRQLNEGAYQLKTRAIDNDNNLGVYGSILNLIIDRSKPNTPGAPTTSASADSSTWTTVPNGGWSKYDKLQFSWTAPTDTGVTGAVSGIKGYKVYITSENNGVISPVANWVSTIETKYALTGSHNTIYRWQVKAVDKAGNESDATPEKVIKVDLTTPSAPGLVTTWPTYSATQTLNANWSPSSDSGSELHYEVQVTDNTTVSGWQSKGTLTSHSINGADGHEYLLEVKAVDQAGNESSVVFTGTRVDVSAPTAPVLTLSEYVTSNTDNNIALSWTAATDTVSGLDHYELFITDKNGTILPVDDLSTTSYAFKGYDGDRYTCYVVAVDKAGNSSSSETKTVTIDFTAPGQPGKPVAINATEFDCQKIAKVRFEWTKPADNDIKGYQVQLVETPGDKKIIDWTAPLRTETFVEYEAGVDGKSYTCTVKAMDNAGLVGPPSETEKVTVDLAVPTVSLLEVPIAVNSQLAVEADTSDPISGVKQVEFTANGKSQTDIASPFTGLWDTTAWAEGKYTVTALAEDKAGNTATTTSADIIVDRTIPNPPVSLQVNGLVNGYVKTSGITFNWPAAVDPNAANGATASGVEKYKVVIIENPGPNPNILQQESVPGTTYSFTGTNGTSYQLLVRTVDKAENESADTSITITVDTIPPVLSFTMPPFTNSTTVSVTVNATDANGIEKIYLSNGSNVGPWTELTGTLWTLPTGDGNKEVYTKAVDRAGNETVVSAETLLDMTVPGVPTSLVANCDNDNRAVSISWVGVTDTAGSGLAGYRVQYRINGGHWQPHDGLITDNGWTKGSLTSRDRIQFQVSSEDRAGNQSAWSVATSEVCLASVPASQVTGLTATSGSANNLPWYRVVVGVAPITDCAGYKYYRKIGTQTPLCLTPDGTTSTSYIDNSVSAHGVYAYGYTTYNALHAESSIKWADQTTTVSPGIMAPEVMVPNIAPSITVTGPAGLYHQPQLTFTLGKATDMEGDRLEYRLYQRSYGQTGSGVKVTAWTPDVDQSTVNANLPEGDLEWQIRCIEKDLTQSGEVAASGWTRVIIDGTPPKDNFTFKICPQGSTTEIVATKLTDPVRCFLIMKSPDTALADEGLAGLIGGYYWTGTEEPSTPTLISPANLTSPENCTITTIDGAITVIHLTVIDRSGNKRTVSKTVKYDTTAPSHPDPAQVVGTAGLKKIDLSWEAPFGETDPLTYKVLWRRPQGVWNTITTGTATTATINGLNDNDLIEIQIVPRDPAGNEQQRSDYDFRGCTLAANGMLSFNVVKDASQGLYRVNFSVSGTSAYKIWRESGNDWVLADPTGDRGRTAHATIKYKLESINALGIPRTDAPTFTCAIPNSPPETPVPAGPTGITGPEVSLFYSGGLDWDNDSCAINYILSGVGPGGESETPSVGTDGKVSGLKHGFAYTWRVTIDDGHGGVVTSAPGSFTVDAKKPVVKVNFTTVRPGEVGVCFTNDPARLAQQTPVIMAYDEDGAIQTFKYKWNPAETENYADWPALTGTTLTAPVGGTVLKCFVIDNHGNSQLFTINCIVDGNAPQVGQVKLAAYLPQNPGAYYVTSREIPVSWTASDTGGAGLSYVKYAFVTSPTVGPGTSFRNFAGAPSTTSLQILTGGEELQDGSSYFVAIVAVDKAGNESNPAYSDRVFFLDGSAPVLTSLSTAGFLTYGEKRYITDSTVLTVNYEANDPDSTITKVEYALVDGGNLSGASAPVWVTDPAQLLATPGLTGGTSYALAVRLTNGVGTQTIFVDDVLLIYDTTGPGITHFIPATTEQRDQTTLTGQIQLTEKESVPAMVELAIGTTSGGNQVSATLLSANASGWLENPCTGNLAVYTVTDLNLTDGTYYLTARARNVLGLTGEATTVAVTVNSLLPARPVVYSNGRYTGSPAELYARWEFPDAPFTVDFYEYRVVTSTLPVTDWTNAGTAMETLITGLNLTEGTEYFVEVRAVFNGGGWSETGRSAGMIVDTTPPVITLLEDGAWADLSGLRLEWGAEDPESDLKNAEAAVGTTPGGTDVSDGWIPLTASPFHFTSLPLEDGKVYYVTVRVTNWAGETTIGKSDGVVVDGAAPTVPYVRDQGRFHSTNGRVSASWAWTADWQPYTVSGSGLARCEVTVTNRPTLAGTENWTTVTGETSYEYPGALVDGVTYYFFVRVTNNAGTTVVGRSDGITIDANAPDLPTVNDGPVNYYNASGLNGTGEITVSFSAVDLQSGINHFVYAYGTPDQVENAPEYSSGDDFTESFPVNRFPDGSMIIFRAKAFNNTVETSETEASGTGYSDGFVVDASGPGSFTITDEGAYTGEKLLRFNWTLPESNTPLTQIRYALTTNPNYQPSLTGTLPLHNPEAPVLNTWVRLAGILRTLQIGGDILQNGQRYYLRMVITDAAGNESGAQVSDGILIDVTPPAKPDVSVSGGGWCSQVLRADLQAVDAESGIAMYECAVGLTRGGAEVSGGWLEVPAVAATVWEGTFPGISSGQMVYLSVRARNRAGMYGETWSSLGIVVDTDGPAVTVSGSTVVNQSLAISGTATDTGAGVVKVEFSGNDLVVEDTTPPYTALWNTSDWSEGDHTVTFRAVDMVGNWSETATTTVKVDRTKPTPPGTPAAAERYLNQKDFTWRWDPATDVNGSGIRDYLVKITDETGQVLQNWTPTTPAGATSFSYTGVNGKTYQCMVKAVDQAGNESDPSGSGMVTIDLVPPGTPEAPASSARFINTINVTFSWNTIVDEGSGLKEYLVRILDTQGAVIRNWENPIPAVSTSYSFVGVDGMTYLCEVKAVDRANNESEVSGAGMTTIDMTSPTVTITKAPLLVNGGLSVDAQAADNFSGIAKVEFTVGGDTVEDTVAPYTASWETLTWADGNHTVTVLATDGAGNASLPAVVTVQVDQTPPGIPGTPMAEKRYLKTKDFGFYWTGASDVNNGSGLRGYEVYIVENPGTDEVIKVNWKLTTTPYYLVTGEHGKTYGCKVRAVDLAENRSEETTTGLVTVDLTPPVVEIMEVSDFTNVTAVTVKVQATDSVSKPEHLFLAEQSNGPWTDMGAFSAGSITVIWNLSDGAGTKIIHAKITDSAENETFLNRETVLDKDVPPAPQPAIPVCDNVTRNVTVSWSAVTEASPGSGVRGYEVEYRVSGGLWTPVPEIAASSWTKGGLTASQPVSFRVRAVDRAGNRSVWSVVTSEVCLAALPAARIVSQSNTAQLVDGRPEYRITVTAAAVADTAGYKFYQRNSDGTIIPLTPGGTASLVYTDTNLTAHAVYEYGYTTYNVLGNESAICWPELQTQTDPSWMAPRIMVRNIAPLVTATGPGNGIRTIDSTVRFQLGAVADAEQDSLEYRLYRRSQGETGNGMQIAVWKPAVNQAQVTAVFSAGVSEWRLCCIEADTGILDRTEVPVTGWNIITVTPYEPIPYCINVLGERNWGTKGQPLAFAVETDDVEPAGLTFEWDFGDGSPKISGKEVAHIFDELSPVDTPYLVRVTVRDAVAGTYSDTVRVRIVNTPRGVLYRNETWTGSHQITGDVVVPVGLQLTITPGTTVTAAVGYGLVVRGRLEAVDSGQTIRFTGGDFENFWWSGIRFEGTAEGRLNGVVISGAERGVAIIGTTVTIQLDGCLFDRNLAGIHIYGGTQEIGSVEFSDNRWYGIKEDGGGRPVVRGCAFRGNSMDYYHEMITDLSLEELNELPGNRDNHK